MAALAADRKLRLQGEIRRTFIAELAASTTIYAGALVAKNAAGYVVPASDTAALRVIGFALEQVVNSGAAGAKSIQLGTGVIEFDNAGGAIVQAGKHLLCYAADDQSVSTAAAMTNDVIAGRVVDFTTTKVFVDVDPAYGGLAS